MAWYPQARALLISVVILSHMGCTAFRPYKMDIHQGNILEPEKVEKLQIGMNRAQVHQLLGTPMLDDAFQKDQWDYIYYTKPGYGKANEKRILIYFTNGKVSNIQKEEPIQSKSHP